MHIAVISLFIIGEYQARAMIRLTHINMNIHIVFERRKKNQHSDSMQLTIRYIDDGT